MTKKIMFQIVAIGVVAIVGAALSGCMTPSANLGTPITISALPTQGGGKQGTCPGTYAGAAAYTKSITNGWGWAPDTNTTIHTAANGGGRTDVKIEFLGAFGDSGCAAGSVTIPSPTLSPKYDFAIYFASNPPTTNYPIILTGFNP
jgi:hypothetical protein